MKLDSFWRDVVFINWDNVIWRRFDMALAQPGRYGNTLYTNTPTQMVFGRNMFKQRPFLLKLPVGRSLLNVS